MPKEDKFKTEETTLEPAIAAPSSQYKPAPSREAVLAYWTPGREKEEAETLMDAHKVKCARCDAFVYYMPERDKDAPVNLVCGAH